MKGEPTGRLPSPTVAFIFALVFAVTAAGLLLGAISDSDEPSYQQNARVVAIVQSGRTGKPLIARVSWAHGEVGSGSSSLNVSSYDNVEVGGTLRVTIKKGRAMPVSRGVLADNSPFFVSVFASAGWLLVAVLLLRIRRSS